MTLELHRFETNVLLVGEFKDFGNLHRKQGLRTILNRINEEYSDSFVGSLELTDDYRVIGVMNNIDNLSKIILKLKNDFFPLQLLCGIAIGENSNSNFSLACQALDEVKNSKRRKEKAVTDVFIRIENDMQNSELAINTIYKLLYLIEQSWTSKQRSVIHTMIFENTTQANVANMYEVSASNIQQMLTNGHYFAYREAMENMDSILKKFLGMVNNKRLL